MSTLKLRQIGDTVVLILPKTLLEQLSAKSEDRKLVIKPKRKLRRLPKYDLSGLLLEHKQIMVRLEAEYQTVSYRKFRQCQCSIRLMPEC